MSDLSIGESVARPLTSSNALYRAVWRWHFYAGLLVLPFLISLSITGALYLFHNEIEGIVYRDLKLVERPAGAVLLAPSKLIAAASAAQPGTVVKFTTPSTPEQSAEITMQTDADEKLAVYVNPYSGAVLGTLPDRGTIMWTVRYLHSLKFFGPVARACIEIAAGWSILLVATGIYLWWPRRQRGGVVTVRGKPKQRVFWRDVHAVTGIFVGVFLVFLAFTGMPWSGVWGGKVNEWANGNNFGYPAGVRVSVPMSGEELNSVAPTSWSMEQAKMPLSHMPGMAHSPHTGDAMGEHDMSTHTTTMAHDMHAPVVDAPSIGIDKAVETLDALGLTQGYAVNLPQGPTGVYTGSIYPADVEKQRVVHLDQFSGEPLIDMSYADYGPLGRWLEWSINVHLGQQFGLANQLVLLVVCLAIVLLAVSAGVMWWKRRPEGKLGVPPLPQDRRVFRGLLFLLFAGGVVFPLVGLSFVVMLALDVALTRGFRLNLA